MLVDDRGRLALAPYLMAHGDENERAAGAFLPRHRLDDRAADDGIADADVAGKGDAAARPHAAWQLVHRRQEAAALRMSVRADLRLARVGQEEQPVAERRHGVAFLRTGIGAIECRGEPVERT